MKSSFACLCLLLCLFSSQLFADFPVKQETVAKITAALPDSAPATPKTSRHILIYSKTSGFRHGSIPTGVKAMQMLGAKTRAFSAVHSEDRNMFYDETLAQFDAVIMLNTTGDCLAGKKNGLTDADKLTLEQRKKNLHDFVTGGKGMLGIHSATDTFYSWKAYGDMMGGWFTGHPWHQNVPLKIDSPDHPLTSMFDVN